MKIAILGFGKQGLSAYHYWHKDSNQISIHDLNQQTDLPADVTTKLGPDYLKDLDQYDLIIRSPIIHLSDIVEANSPAILDKVTTPTNEFFKVSPTKNIIGVTGTKGKGTTSALVTHLLKELGFKAHLGGNFGTSPLDMLKFKIGANDWVILELANFQLVDLIASPPIAVCLMVVPDHLNWHKDMDEYIEAKQQLFKYQKEDDIAIYFADNELSKRVVSVSRAQKIPYFAGPGAIVQNNQFKIADQVVCATSDIKLLGEHNWENVCAAITVVWQISQGAQAIGQAIKSFPGLEHRLELVKQISGVSYYNDSFASAPDAAIAALKAVPGSKVVIVGGFDRGLELGHLAKAIKQAEHEIVKLILIGASAKRVEGELNSAGFSNYEISHAKTMPEIVGRARQLAQAGQSVVLSPGFPSFDMFKNFEERGEAFRQAVQDL